MAFSMQASKGQPSVYKFISRVWLVCFKKVLVLYISILVFVISCRKVET
jgi:hypothetical protein